MSKSETSERFGLKMSDLTAVRGYALLFSGLSANVEPGRFVAVRGPNGSGKTTLLRMLAGLLPPASGKISRPDEIREQGPFYLGHESGLRPNETALSHLRDWADLHHAPRHTIDLAAGRVGLKARALVPAYALSAGQKKRLGLARALVAPRNLWLLDEPAASLDTGGQALLAELIREHTHAGGICLAALHDPLDLAPDEVIDLAEYRS